MVELIKRYKWWLFGIIFLGGLVAWVERWWGSRDHSQDAVILAASTKHGVDPALVKAVVWRESWFDASAKGTSGEVGLMQIMNATASDWAAAQRIPTFTHHQLFDPALNTDCGAWYLRKLLMRYRGTDNPVVYALAAYNAGPTRVTKWSKGTAVTNSAEFLKQVDFPGTKKYVKSVMERYQHYRKTPPAQPAKELGAALINRHGLEPGFHFRAQPRPFFLGKFARHMDGRCQVHQALGEWQGDLKAVPALQPDLPGELV